MTSNSEEPQAHDYLLPRTFMSSCRLTGQHNLMIWRNGWLLHPRVKKHLESGSSPTIADIGTGNGIWALQLGEEDPDYQILGLDVSSEQLPALWTWPPNVQFELHNLTSPVPQHLRSRFDALHVRLLSGALTSSNLEIAVQNTIDMLKPGGILQWHEAIFPFWRTVDDNMRIDDSLPDFVQPVDQYLGGRLSASADFDWENVFRRSGFIEVERHDPEIRPGLLKHETDYCRWALEEVIEKTKSMAADTMGASLLPLAQSRLDKFIAGGNYLSYRTAVFTAQKPA